MKCPANRAPIDRERIIENHAGQPSSNELQMRDGCNGPYPTEGRSPTGTAAVARNLRATGVPSSSSSSAWPRARLTSHSRAPRGTSYDASSCSSSDKKHAVLTRVAPTLESDLCSIDWSLGRQFTCSVF